MKQLDKLLEKAEIFRYSFRCPLTFRQNFKWRNSLLTSEFNITVIAILDTVVLVFFATRVKKRKVEIKIRAFLASCGQTTHFLDQFVLFIQSCKLPKNWINRLTTVVNGMRPLLLPVKW